VTEQELPRGLPEGHFAVVACGWLGTPLATNTRKHEEEVFCRKKLISSSGLRVFVVAFEVVASGWLATPLATKYERMKKKSLAITSPHDP
jgi:hypothetical protein